jgi:hypothetical protein
MNRTLIIALISFFGLAGCAVTQQAMAPRPDPLTLEQLVALGKSGKDATAIIEEIKKAGTEYDVTASQFAKLSRDGVPDAVLDFMQKTQLRLARREGRRDAAEDAWFYGRMGWGYGYYSPYLFNWHGRPTIRYW